MWGWYFEMVILPSLFAGFSFCLANLALRGSIRLAVRIGKWARLRINLWVNRPAQERGGTDCPPPQQ